MERSGCRCRSRCRCSDAVSEDQFNDSIISFIGGRMYTDQPLRTVFYSSFRSIQVVTMTSLITSYCWMEDATRWVPWSLYGQYCAARSFSIPYRLTGILFHLKVPLRSSGLESVEISICRIFSDVIMYWLIIKISSCMVHIGRTHYHSRYQPQSLIKIIKLLQEQGYAVELFSKVPRMLFPSVPTVLPLLSGFSSPPVVFPTYECTAFPYMHAQPTSCACCCRGHFSRWYLTIIGPRAAPCSVPILI